ncbi:hypothetical protein [Macrococcoides caseolyticum]|uniref:hypothetical protein n=1 Tax=Macrococcoides caseolyticum TaxID=69966 RepID=UPI0030ED080D
MIPKYTTSEIVAMIQRKDGIKHEALELKDNEVWSLSEYQLAAEYLKMDVTELMSFLPAEDINSISFRAEENNEEIHDKVTQLNEIFEAVIYQIKIGDHNNGEI